ncbi:MAG: POTRA domain-containing protein, partial [Candidatus Acidiferrales bacterium]
MAVVDLSASPDVSPEPLRPLIEQESGQPFSTAKIEASVDALKRTGRFTDVRVQVEPVAEGLRVFFVMLPA